MNLATNTNKLFVAIEIRFIPLLNVNKKYSKKPYLLQNIAYANGQSGLLCTTTSFV